MNGFTPYLYELLRGPQNHDFSKLEEMTMEGIQGLHEHFSFYDLPAMYAPEPQAYIEPVTGGYEPISQTPEIRFKPEQIQEEPPEVSYDTCVMTPELMQHILDNLPHSAWPTEALQIGELSEAHEIVEAVDYGPSPFDPTFDQNLMEIQQSIMMVQEQFIDPFLM